MGRKPNKRTAGSGLADALFSRTQQAVLGLLFGRAGEAEYADEIVRRADVVELRRKVVATATEGIAEDAADVTVRLKGGRSVHVHVEHAIGSLARPMSDADLEAKFHGLADPVLGKVKAAALHELCRKIAAAVDVHALCEGARP